MSGWVLIKGLKQDQRHWLGFDQRLQERLGAPVVCLDLPGAGTRAGRPVPASVEGMAAELRGQWLERVGETEGPWGVLGLSLGGMVAMAWAHAFPDDLQWVVLGNTSARQTGGPHERLHWRAWRTLLRALREPDVVKRESLVIGMVSRHTDDARRAELARTYARFHDEAPYDRRAFMVQLLAGSRYHAPPPLPQRVLVLSGAGDTFVSPRCSDRLAEHLEAELQRHPTAGHDLSLDAPGWLADSIESWMLRHPA